MFFGPQEGGPFEMGKSLNGLRAGYACVGMCFATGHAGMEDALMA